ncbi:MAG: YkvA family protein [Anaerolineae bacterium]
MAEKRDIIIPPQGNMIRDFILRVKLILRLIGDKRVNPWLKVIPIAGLAYLVSPLDIIPDIMLPVIGELDDAAILWLTNYLFIELCPPDVVEEHVKALGANLRRSTDDDVIDAESVEIKERRR